MLLGITAVAGSGITGASVLGACVAIGAVGGIVTTGAGAGVVAAGTVRLGAAPGLVTAMVG